MNGQVKPRGALNVLTMLNQLYHVFLCGDYASLVCSGQVRNCLKFLLSIKVVIGEGEMLNDIKQRGAVIPEKVIVGYGRYQYNRVGNFDR